MRSDEINSCAEDNPISYMERTRQYYLALGYNNPYQWAHFENTPFTKLKKTLLKSRVALVTTAAPYVEGVGDQGPGAPYNAEAKFYKVYAMSINGSPDVRISHVGIDRAHTTAEDINTWLPLTELKRQRETGRIGSLTPRFYGLPTNRSQKTTLEQDCPTLFKLIERDEADIVILAANCPVCHQCISIAARYLEEAGLATVVLGCAKDIVEHVGVPRFVFSDFPLGNPAGVPGDKLSRKIIIDTALNLLEYASKPRTTRQSGLAWQTNNHWKKDYCNANHLTQEELQRRKKTFDKQKQTAKQVAHN